MISTSPLQFVLHLSGATALGAIVGLEREWRQRMAGTRTNALVAAGASAFVMAGVGPYVVSGIGFLGAGVIFQDGGNVRGLNTAATIWCSAGIGILSGLDALPLALFLAIVILLANIGLRPLVYRFHRVLPSPEHSDTLYEIVLTCRCTDETHLRALLLGSMTQEPATLQALHSESEPGLDRLRLRAQVSTRGRQNELIEKIALRLSIEPGIASMSWSMVPTAIE
jgi:putative Mg2+ transporter-C (MgtC) family protein